MQKTRALFGVPSGGGASTRFLPPGAPSSPSRQHCLVRPGKGTPQRKLPVLTRLVFLSLPFLLQARRALRAYGTLLPRHPPPANILVVVVFVGRDVRGQVHWERCVGGGGARVLTNGKRKRKSDSDNRGPNRAEASSSASRVPLFADGREGRPIATRRHCSSFGGPEAGLRQMRGGVCEKTT